MRRELVVGGLGDQTALAYEIEVEPGVLALYHLGYSVDDSLVGDIAVCDKGGGLARLVAQGEEVVFDLDYSAGIGSGEDHADPVAIIQAQWGLQGREHLAPM